MTKQLARIDDGEVRAARAAMLVARRALDEGAKVLGVLGRKLDVTFHQAIAMVSSCQRRVVVSGAGRSGLAAREIASAFASAGIPSAFLNAAEAAHGDLGLVQPGDVLLLVSTSDCDEELVNLLPFFQELGVRMIALVCRADSELASATELALEIGGDRGVGDRELGAVLSSVAALALGSALALAVRERRAVAVGGHARSGLMERVDVLRHA